MKTWTTLLAAVLCLAFGATGSSPQAKPAALGRDQLTVPQFLSYQGKVTDSIGQPVPNGVYAVTFSLYAESTGGSAFWTELQNVQTRTGLFSVQLGKVTPLTYVPWDGNCWLEMQVHPDPVMSPRIRIVSAAYAYMAAVAETAMAAGSAAAVRPLSPGVSNAEIAANAVTTDKVQDHTLRGADFAMPCSLITQSAGNPYAAIMIQAINTANGIRIDTADNVGIIIVGTRNTGVLVDSAGSNGVDVYAATTYGVKAKGYSAGGYFSAGDAGAIGLVARSYNGVAADTAIRAYGKGLASGGWATGFKDGGEAPCIVSAERAIIASGSARLNNGRAEISLPEVFTKHVRPEVPVRLNVTPTADAPGLLVAERRGNAGFAVRLRRIAGLDGADDATFDWIAVGALEEPNSEPAPDRER